MPVGLDLLMTTGIPARSTSQPARRTQTGSEWLLELLLDDSPAAYRRFAEEYYELK
jgi:hypothetical protein